MPSLEGEYARIRDSIHRRIVRLVATSPAGRGLCLIGGTRLRLLNESVRLSNDVDFHWEGDLAEKQTELVALLQQRLLPDVRKDHHLDGSVARASGPDAESDFVKTVEVRFYGASQRDGSPIRLDFPIDVTRVPRVDAPRAYPAEGTVVLTLSDQDLVEAKVVALFARTFYRPRDILDIYLFSHFFGPDSPQRLAEKLRTSVSPESIERRLADIQGYRDGYCQELRLEIAKTVEEEAAQRIATAGGAEMILEQVLTKLRALLPRPVRLPEPPSAATKTRGPER